MNKIKEFGTLAMQLILSFIGACAFVFIVSIMVKVLFKLTLLGWNLW